MNIPLYAKAIESPDKTDTMLEIWTNKQKTIINIPFKPYLYSKTRRLIPCATESKETVKYISDLKQHDVFKYVFRSVKDIPEFRDDDSMECDIPFIQRVAIDDPNFFGKYPQTDDLDIMCFDIECDSEGIFPKSDRNPIIGIGYCFNDEAPNILLTNSAEESDAGILKKFMDDVKRRDPDIIVTYFGNLFDLPYLIDRLIRHGISTSPLTRSGGEAFFEADKGRIVFIKGRAMFDIYDEVRKDQSLFGIPSRKMKDVAKWFKLDKVIRKYAGFENYDIVTEDVSNISAIAGTEQLKTYLLSDVLVTRELSKIYLPTVISFSEMIGVPLNIMMQRTSSMPHTILSARSLKQLNIISDAPNYIRFPKIFGTPTYVTKRGKTETVFVGGTRFQGALVSINPSHQSKPIYEKIYNVDVVSMYPSIIMYFNISPETVSLVEEKEYIKDYFNIRQEQDFFLLEVADDRIKKNLVIRILKEEGIITKEIKRFFNERMIIKEKVKDANEHEKLHFKSMLTVYKVILNSAFGVCGNGHFRYSSVTQAIAITAIGRYIISYVIKKYGDSLLLSDTDGAYGMNNIDAVQLSKEVNDMFMNNYGMKTNFAFEQDIYDAGFALKMKNYILLKGDNLIKHGVSFKASSKNLIFANALNKIALALLTKPEDLYPVAKECYDVYGKDFSEFVMRTQINRAIKEYAIQPTAGKKGCLQVQVARQASAYHDMDIRVGDQLSYVKTHLGYEIRETAQGKKDMLDYGYYRKQVISVLERFKLKDVIWKLKNPGQRTLLSNLDV
jgi:DNA polymerase I